jgi:hypothetical protein
MLDVSLSDASGCTRRFQYFWSPWKLQVMSRNMIFLYFCRRTVMPSFFVHVIIRFKDKEIGEAVQICRCN